LYIVIVSTRALVLSKNHKWLEGMSQVSKGTATVSDVTVFLIHNDELLCETGGLKLGSVGLRC